MEQTTYQQAEKIVDNVLVAVGCEEYCQAIFFKNYLSELIAIFPEVREHTEHRIHMLKLYKEKGLL
jgi:hypothetical protein